MDDVAYFRANAAAMVINDDGQVLALERSDVPDSWQAPQGGIRSGEEPLEAVLREVEEETGIRRGQLTVLKEYPHWLAYELPPDSRGPKTGRGQVQRWFLLRSSVDPKLLAASDLGGQEFMNWRWMPMMELVEGVWYPRRPTYRLLASVWQDHFV